MRGASSLAADGGRRVPVARHPARRGQPGHTRTGGWQRRHLVGRPTALAEADIPADYLSWYINAARTCPGLPWPVLAGIGKVESDHGRSDLPGVHSGANTAGAEGPMQFLPATFGEFAVNADPGQPLSPYDPADAIYTAARMLCADGARGGSTAGIEQAIFAYNHAGWYVSEVMSWAASTPPRATMVWPRRRSRSRRHSSASLLWGAAGPDAYDCSGLVFAAYAAAGIHIARTTFQWQQDGPVVPLSQLQPGDLLFCAGSDGTPANPGHVVMYLGNGQVIQAPRPARTSRSTPPTWPASSSPPAPPNWRASHDPDHPSSGDNVMNRGPAPRRCRPRHHQPQPPARSAKPPGSLPTCGRSLWNRRSSAGPSASCTQSCATSASPPGG